MKRENKYAYFYVLNNARIAINLSKTWCIKALNCNILFRRYHFKLQLKGMPLTYLNINIIKQIFEDHCVGGCLYFGQNRQDIAVIGEKGAGQIKVA